MWILPARSQPQTNPVSHVAVLLGGLSLVPVLGLVLGPIAIVLGVLGLRARRANPALPGKGRSVTAIVLGGLTLAFQGTAIAYAVLFPLR